MPAARTCRTLTLGTFVAVALALAAGTGAALLLAPAVLAFCLVMLGLRPGEQLIDRLRGRFADRRARRAPRCVAPRAGAVVAPRTAWIPASALAMRPPPPRPAAVSY